MDAPVDKMDPERAERLKRLQMDDLGSARREYISTSDNTRRFHARIEEIEAARMSNVAGSKAQLLAQKNAKELSAWANVYKEISDTGDLEDLDELLHGQSHRMHLTAMMHEIGGQNYEPSTRQNIIYPTGPRAALGSQITSPRRGEQRGRGGGIMGTRGRGSFMNVDGHRITAPSVSSSRTSSYGTVSKLGNHIVSSPRSRPLDPALDANNNGSQTVATQKIVVGKKPEPSIVKVRRPINPPSLCSPEDFLAAARSAASRASDGNSSVATKTSNGASNVAAKDGDKPRKVSQNPSGADIPKKATDSIPSVPKALVKSPLPTQQSKAAPTPPSSIKTPVSAAKSDLSKKATDSVLNRPQALATSPLPTPPSKANSTPPSSLKNPISAAKPDVPKKTINSVPSRPQAPVKSPLPNRQPKAASTRPSSIKNPASAAKPNLPRTPTASSPEKNTRVRENPRDVSAPKNLQGSKESTPSSINAKKQTASGNTAVKKPSSEAPEYLPANRATVVQTERSKDKYGATGQLLDFGTEEKSDMMDLASPAMQELQGIYFQKSPSKASGPPKDSSSKTSFSPRGKIDFHGSTSDQKMEHQKAERDTSTSTSAEPSKDDSEIDRLQNDINFLTQYMQNTSLSDSRRKMLNECIEELETKFRQKKQASTNASAPTKELSQDYTSQTQQPVAPQKPVSTETQATKTLNESKPAAEEQPLGQSSVIDRKKQDSAEDSPLKQHVNAAPFIPRGSSFAHWRSRPNSISSVSTINQPAPEPVRLAHQARTPSYSSLGDQILPGRGEDSERSSTVKDELALSRHSLEEPSKPKANYQIPTPPSHHNRTPSFVSGGHIHMNSPESSWEPPKPINVEPISNYPPQTTLTTTVNLETTRKPTNTPSPLAEPFKPAQKPELSSSALQQSMWATKEEPVQQSTYAPKVQPIYAPAMATPMTQSMHAPNESQENKPSSTKPSPSSIFSGGLSSSRYATSENHKPLR